MWREAMVCITTVAFMVTTLMAQRTASEYQWDLPPRVPSPRLPVDTPITPERVELGRYLFYDTRLSGNGTQSCATCHIQALAFTDGRSRAVGSTGERHPRSSMSLANVAYRDALTWANPALRSLEEQVLVPMFGADPVELGLTTSTRPASNDWSRPRTSRWLWPRSCDRSFRSGHPTTASGSTTTRPRSHRPPGAG